MGTIPQNQVSRPKSNIAPNPSGLYLQWAESWGFTLAFSITQSLPKAEQCIADAMVALVVSSADKPEITSKAPKAEVLRFANSIWAHSKRHAFQGVSSDLFFRASPVIRACVVLKVNAKFSRIQIAKALGISPSDVDASLAIARDTFYSGKT
jgi:lambda repressor-like predicted transcriptional regulator